MVNSIYRHNVLGGLLLPPPRWRIYWNNLTSSQARPHCPVLLRVSTSYMGLGGLGGLCSLMFCCSFFSISVAKLSISFDCSVVSCKKKMDLLDISLSRRH
jgi:hypothetical protein